ncbi:hypothetical protein BXY75_1231 [Ulvibacter antarcticus]|uniref:Uncharacterized protein n=1 Tax=Ulvibacter antarcticus TaxID=442714 RepID=A0A3L9YX04_9FLAO|nr:hypothetical protein BXY75_1231 [Ulvibacter antarcticus]
MINYIMFTLFKIKSHFLLKVTPNEIQKDKTKLT